MDDSVVELEKRLVGGGRGEVGGYGRIWSEGSEKSEREGVKEISVRTHVRIRPCTAALHTLFKCHQSSVSWLVTALMC